MPAREPNDRSVESSAADSANEALTDRAVARAVDELRTEVLVRADWRNELLREVAAQPTPSRHLPSSFMPEVRSRKPAFLRSFAIHPLAALAACLLAMLAGVGGTVVYMRSSSAPSVVVSRADARAQVVPVANSESATNPDGQHKVIRFALVAPNATHVSIVGDFNNWNASATPLKTSRDGNTWMIDLPLSAGRHVYAFVVDGDLVADPSAPRVVDHDFGVQNSVILVGAS